MRAYHVAAEAVVCCLLLTLANGCSPGRSPFPPTEKKPVTDEYHGIKVTDDYRWLGDLKDPAVRKWSDEQNRYSRAYLDNISFRPLIAERLKEISGERSVRYHTLEYRNKLFCLKSQPPKNQPFLVTLSSADDLNTERIVVDPNTLDPQGTTAIDFYVASPDGRLVAVSMSKNGSEDGSVYLFEVETGRQLGDVIPGVQRATAGGSVAWNKDGSGFYYTRYPQGEERPKEDMNFFQQVYFHRLGTASSADTYVIGREFPKIAEIQLKTSDDGNYLLASVANGDGGAFEHYLRDPKGMWTQVTHFTDAIVTADFGSDGMMYLLSHSGAPRGKIIRIPLARPKLENAKVIVPESEAVVSAFLPTATRLYVSDLIGGPSQVRVFELAGKEVGRVGLRPVASVGEIIRLDGDGILYGSETYLDPPALFLYDPVSGESKKTALSGASGVGFVDAEVVREFATSKDGTRIPMNIIRRKGTLLDGKNPTLLYGYGGFSSSQVPRYLSSRRIWLEQGGVYVVASLRGGGEYGEEWHAAGSLRKKQNVFDDFVACAQYLIEQKYTDPQKLAIQGGSNGGLLMGAALTQHPGFFRAVVSHVGIYDMLRVELFPNGEFNITEYGTVKDPEQFRALYAYSPYHHVVDGTPYPAVLLLTGDNDGRVDPANSRKMTARLQAATTSKMPILLRTSSSSGHGIGTGLSERVAQDADVYSFLFYEMGVGYKGVK